MRAGKWLGLADGVPVAGGESFDDVVQAVLDRLLDEPRGLLTLLTGVDAPALEGLLEEITAALGTLPGGRTPTPDDWNRLSESWRGRINDQIDRLERLRDRLDSCIGCGCLSLNRCSLSNPDDVVRGRGPGAVYLEPSAD